MELRTTHRKAGELIERVRELRKAAGLSQLALARRAGLTRKTIWSVEADPAHAANVRTLTKVAHALGVDVTELLTAAAA